MKKTRIFILLVFLSLFLVACDFWNRTESSTIEQVSTSQLQTTSSDTILTTKTTTQFPTSSTTTTQTSTNSTTTTQTSTTTTSTTETSTMTTTTETQIYPTLNPGQDTVEIHTSWTDAGAQLVVFGGLYDMTTSDTVDTSVLGIQEIVYTLFYDGTTYEISRFVMVADQTDPLIQLNIGVDTVQVGTTWTDAGVVVEDNSGEILTATVSGTVDTTTVGSYIITYTATDSSGNSSSIFRYVYVVE